MLFVKKTRQVHLECPFSSLINCACVSNPIVGMHPGCGTGFRLKCPHPITRRIAQPAGPQGPQGDTGLTGAQGPATIGPSGPTGPTGQQGAQGSIGMTGAKGSTTIGPAGLRGVTGSAGAQGAIGETGLHGSTTPGVAGPVGPRGAIGEQGQVGRTGAEGPAGVVAGWSPYKEFFFSSDNADISATDRSKLSEVANYMKNNPSLQVGIDGYMKPRDRDLSNRRIDAVRNGLIDAGMSSDKIKTGEFGDMKLRSEGRVEVLICTGN